LYRRQKIDNNRLTEQDNKTNKTNKMNTLPTEIVRMIMTYRGTDTFEALSHEMDSAKRYTAKYRQDVLARIIKASVEDESITHKEMLILFKHKALKQKKVVEPWEKVKRPIHPDH